MKTIYKYSLKTTDVQTLQLPVGYQILCVQVQIGIPCLWALVNPEYGTTKVTIATFGTGHNVNENYKLDYIDTYQLEGGSLIFHVFEVL